MMSVALFVFLCFIEGTSQEEYGDEIAGPEVIPSMIEWLKKRSLATRVLVYAVAAILAFAVAAGVGATAALMIRGDLSLPTREEPQPAGEQGNAPQRQGAEDDRPEDASQQDEAEYTSKVGAIQSKSVETFLDTHERLLRYDALTAEDVEEMRANQAALRGYSDQVRELNPPRRFGDQYEVFRSAINELHQAAQLAHDLAADPTAATQSGFEEYDRHVNQAAARLQRSNEVLDRDYETIEGVQGVSPLS
jgi:hypothetical protein